MAADFGSLGKNTQGALVAGAVTVLLTFFPWFVKISIDAGEVPGFDFSDGINAWHEWGVFAALLLLVATVLVAIKAFAADTLPDTVPWSLVILATAGLGTVLLVLYGFTAGGDVPSGVTGIDIGPGWSGYLVFITAIVFTVFAFLGFKDSGEKVPEFKKDTPPAA